MKNSAIRAMVKKQYKIDDSSIIKVEFLESYMDTRICVTKFKVEFIDEDGDYRRLNIDVRVN